MSTSKDMDFSKMLTSFDIELCRENLDDLVIAPFDKTQAKGIGYNIAASDLFYSLKKSMPLKICHDDSGSYAIIKPNDTVLVLSYEYLKTNNCVAGTFHSKVRGAASGLGNVSTTLDPNWKGMLLISINNPTSRKIKVPITIKKDGKKLYELAREGIEVERKPRKVHISAITVLDDSHATSEGFFTMEVKCSKGTYIRTLCHDIGLRLGCGAAMQHLTRTRVGAFTLDTAVTLSQIENMRDEGTLPEIIQSPEYIFRDLDKIHVKNAARTLLENGNSFRRNNIVNEDPEGVDDKEFEKEMFSEGNKFRVYSEDDVFFGIYTFSAKTGMFNVDKFFFEK